MSSQLLSACFAAGGMHYNMLKSSYFDLSCFCLHSTQSDQSIEPEAGLGTNSRQLLESLHGFGSRLPFARRMRQGTWANQLQRHGHGCFKRLPPVVPNTSEMVRARVTSDNSFLI